MESIVKRHVSKQCACDIYHKYCKHTSTAIFFTYNGRVYGLSVDAIPTAWVSWGKDAKSRGGQWKLRLTLNGKQMYRLTKRIGCVCLGNESEVFPDMTEYNRGDLIEKILYEAITGKTWHKDNTPWYEGADIETNWCKIQVKFNGASIINMSQVERFIA